MVTLPAHSVVDGNTMFEVDTKDRATIIFKCEGALKDVLYYLAKDDNKYGKTITAVITEMVTQSLKSEHQYTFDKTLTALQTRSVVRSGEAIPYYIKSAMESAVKASNPAGYADELAAGIITVEEVKTKVDEANNTIMKYMAMGYNPSDFHPNKKSFGYKWSEGSWIWEVSKKTDEEETITVGGREVTRLKRDGSDIHYLQYTDNGVTVICPNIFTNALYMSYVERDEYFNRELRKVELQHQQYGKNGKEYQKILEECCPQSNLKEALDLISATDSEIIGAHLVKLERKNKRQYRYMCLDVWNKKDDTYKQIVFMSERGGINNKTTEDFYEVFGKVAPKSRKKTNKSNIVEIGFTDERVKK